jgi:hypothetical protein
VTATSDAARAVLAAFPAVEETVWPAQVQSIGRTSTGAISSVNVTYLDRNWACQWSGPFAAEVALAAGGGMSSTMVGRWVKVTYLRGKPFVECTINGSV